MANKQDIIIKSENYSALNPVVFGYEDCVPSHFFGPAIRTYYLFHFVVSGCGIYKVKDKTYYVKKGEMFIISPFEETYYEADNKNPWSYIWIGFTAGGELPKELPHTIFLPEAEHIFESMKKCSDYTEGSSAFLTARLWDLFALFLSEEKPGVDYVQKALECIHYEYMNDLTIEKIASRLSLDRTYFSVIFKDKVGISPKQYLLNYRMNIAASLLTKRHIPVSVAALSVGYSDVFTFSKMFKRHFGISPVNYIKENREQH